MRKTLFATVAVAAFTATGAFANATLDTILAGDEYIGATITETSVGLLGIKVEATLSDGTMVERRYRVDGTLKSEEIVKDGVKTENKYASDGTLIESESDDGHDDESGDDGDDNDDESDDDSSDDGDDDHGDDHGDDD